MRNLWLNFSLAFLLICNLANAQLPAISYGEHQFFLLDSEKVIRPLNAGGKVPNEIYSQTSTVAGNLTPSARDGKATLAGFNFPSGLAVDQSGNIFVADEKNNSIRKIAVNGIVTTILKKGLSMPTGIVVDRLGNIFIADCYHHSIKKLSNKGIVTTIAGSNQPGNVDSKIGALARFRYPVALAIDVAGNLYVADEGNHKIRKITPTGAVSTYAGTGTAGAEDADIGKQARFNQPNGIAIDSVGNVYVADQLNHKIRKISIKGKVTTFAGTGFAGSVNHKQARFSSFNNPRGITIDQAGNIYVGDVGNQQIREIFTNGEVVTLAGSGIAGSSNNDKGKLATFFFPNGIALDHAGNLLIADGLNNQIRKTKITGYQISPDMLTAGLYFDRATGIFSGTPTQFSEGNDYLVSAYNASGKSSAILNISVSSQPGNALNLDGFDDQVVIPNHSSLTPKTVTVELWVNTMEFSPFARFLVKRNSQRRYDDSYSIGVDSLGYYRAIMASGTGVKGSQAIVISKQKATAGQWCFLSAVFSKDFLSLYVNGELQETKSTGFPISVGINDLAFGFDKAMPYSIDEVRIFSTDRSANIADDMYHKLSSLPGELIAYYDFNLGTSGGQNNAFSRLYDASTNGNHGRLNNFSTNGPKSNWIESYAMVIPQILTAAAINKDGFTAQWLPPILSKADFYLLDVAEDPSFLTYLNGYRAKRVTGLSDMVVGLKSNTIYYYRVCAGKNSVAGLGAYSKAVKVVTK